MPYIEIDGANIYYQAYGDDHPDRSSMVPRTMATTTGAPSPLSLRTGIVFLSLTAGDTGGRITLK